MKGSGTETMYGTSHLLVDKTQALMELGDKNAYALGSVNVGIVNERDRQLYDLGKMHIHDLKIIEESGKLLNWITTQLFRPVFRRMIGRD
jgi:hypothetical protein